MLGMICLSLKINYFHTSLILKTLQIKFIIVAKHLNFIKVLKVNKVRIKFSACSLPPSPTPNTTDSSCGSGQVVLRLLICTMGLILKTSAERY